MLKRIIVNLILIVAFCSSIEAFCFFSTKHENNIFKQQIIKEQSNGAKGYETRYTILKDFNTTVYRPSKIIKTEKNPIILFGCSFADGAGLSDEETPCSKLSDLTNRSCINKAKGATGTQFMYYQLLDENFYKQTPNADYIIYIYIRDHLMRLYNYRIGPLIDMFNLRYEIKDGKLQEIKPIFKPLYSSFAVRRFLTGRVSKQCYKEEFIDNFALFNKIIQESVYLIKKNYPKAKILFVEYPEINQNLFLPQYEIKKLEAMGITFVSGRDLMKNININDKKYWLKDNIHPSKEAWDYFLPRLVENYIN